MAVGCEVDGLICSLSQSGERDTPVQGAKAFFFKNGVQGVCSVAVFRDVQWVGHGVMLGLESDFDYFHRCHDRHCFGDAGSESGWAGD